VKKLTESAMQSAAPVETLERRGFQQELGKVSMNNSRLSHTLHSADGPKVLEGGKGKKAKPIAFVAN
jgi:hypothetical protein